MCMDTISYLLGKKKGGGGGNLQTKDVTITENGTSSVQPDEGYTGLSKVNITTNVAEPSVYNAYIDTTKPYGTNNRYGIGALITTIDTTKIDFSNLKNVMQLFANCTSLVEIPYFDTSKYTNFGQFCSYCQSITTIPQLDTSNATDMNNMFAGCTNLVEIPLLNTSKVTNMRYMFNEARELITIPQLDTSNVQNFQGTFMNCKNLKNVPLLNTSKATDFMYMFNYCQELTTQSLDNILQMCINATSYTGTKTLYRLGISSGFTNYLQIPNLPHYQDFINAGWTIS